MTFSWTLEFRSSYFTKTLEKALVACFRMKVRAQPRKAAAPRKIRESRGLMEIVMHSARISIAGDLIIIRIII